MPLGSLCVTTLTPRGAASSYARSVTTSARWGSGPGRDPVANEDWGPSAQVTDAVLAAFTFVTVAIPMVTNHPGRGDRPVDAVSWLLPVVLSAAMVLRRRWPVPVLVASSAVILGYYALHYPPVGLELPLAAAFYTVAEAGRLWWGIGIGVVLQAFAFSARIMQGQDERVLFGFELPPAIAITAAALALGDSTRNRRRQRAERARAESAAAMEHELEAERRVEQERVHLARELHDVLAHTVSVIGLQAGVAAEAIEDDDRVAAARAVESIRGTSREAMRDLRGALGILRGETRAGAHNGRAPVGSVGHLGLLADTARATGLDVRLDLAADLPPLTAAVDATVYRVVQESLTNVLRHSGAKHAFVRVASGDSHVDVTVTDDGDRVGDGSEEAVVNGGHGIRGMRERVALVGGLLEAGPEPSGGFAVRVRLPL